MTDQIHHILLIDDDAEIRALIRNVLSVKGMQLDEASDGQAGWDLFVQNQYDLVVLDALLPKVDGFQICRRIRKERPHLPILMISGVYRSHDVQVEARTVLGVSSFLTKPFKLSRFTEMVDSLLGIQPTPTEATKTTSFATGKIAATTMPKLLMGIYRRKLTGILELNIEREVHHIAFLEGYPVYSRFGSQDLALGRILIKHGKLSLDEYQEILSNMQRTKKKFGEVAVEGGLFSAAELDDVMKLQVEEKVLASFRGQSGTFRFHMENDFLNRIKINRIDPEKIILEGVKRFYTAQMLDNELATVRDKVLVLNKDVARIIKKLNLFPEELLFTSQLKSGLKLDPILSRGVLDRLNAKQIIFSLIVIGAIDFLDPKEDLDALQAHPVNGELELKIHIPEAYLTSEQEEALEKILTTYLHLRTQDHFSVLGITRKATTQQIEEAYQRLNQEFDAKRFSNIKVLHLEREILAISGRIEEAWRTLSDPLARERYLTELAKAQTKRSFIDNSQRVIEAEHHFFKGKVFMNRGNQAQAELLLRQAIELNPAEAEYHAWLGWAMYHNALPGEDEKKVEAERNIRYALEKDHQLAQAHYFLARILLDSGSDVQEIQALLQTALELDPAHEEAVRTLQLLKKRLRDKRLSSQKRWYQRLLR